MRKLEEDVVLPFRFGWGRRDFTADMTPSPVACRLTDADQARRQVSLQEEVFPGIREVVRLDDGFALRFPGGPQWLDRLVRLIAFERECCPFLLLELRAEPEGGPIWLRMRGPEGTVEFLTGVLRGCGVPVPASPAENG